MASDAPVDSSIQLARLEQLSDENRQLKRRVAALEKVLEFGLDISFFFLIISN